MQYNHEVVATISEMHHLKANRAIRDEAKSPRHHD